MEVTSDGVIILQADNNPTGVDVFDGLGCQDFAPGINILNYVLTLQQNFILFKS